MNSTEQILLFDIKNINVPNRGVLRIYSLIGDEIDKINLDYDNQVYNLTLKSGEYNYVIDENWGSKSGSFVVLLDTEVSIIIIASTVEKINIDIESFVGMAELWRLAVGVSGPTVLNCMSERIAVAAMALRKGGVCYFLWDRTYNDDCKIVSHNVDGSISTMVRPLKHGSLSSFIRYNEAIPLLNKVSSFNEPTFDTIVSSRKPFGIPTSFKNFKSDRFEGALKNYANQKTGYVIPDIVTKNHKWILKHKVIMPYAVGSGDGSTDKFNPIHASPNSICTETYLVIGPSDDAETVQNIMSYINTRFFHFLVTLRKNTQHATQTVFEFVPLQDFRKKWTDAELYEKYQLADQEIDWIEANILPEKM